MRSFAVIAAVAGLAAASGDWKPKGTSVAPVYVTEVLTAYTTYCPKATELTHNGVTYTVTSATTLTISNCPCTVTRPVETASPSSAVAVPSSAAPAPSKPVAASTGATAKPTSYFPSVAAPSSASPASSAPATYTGAANKAQVAGAGLLAVLGAAAAVL